jgi:uncharacterized membrane protein
MMPVATPEGSRPLHRGSSARLEALTDGIFAIAMTLLVLDVRPPAEIDLPHLAEVVPSVIALAISFLVLGTLWFGHRTQFQLVPNADHPVVWLNIAMLGFVSLVPFSAALLARAPTNRVAVVFYGCNLALASLAHAVMWIYATSRPELVGRELPPAFRNRTRLLALMPFGGYALGTVLGLLLPVAGLVVFVLTPFPFVSGLFYRLSPALEPADFVNIGVD